MPGSGLCQSCRLLITSPVTKGSDVNILGVKWGHWIVTPPCWSQNCRVSLPRMRLPPGASLVPPPTPVRTGGEEPGSLLSHLQVVSCSEARCWHHHPVRADADAARCPGHSNLFPISVHSYRQERPGGVSSLSFFSQVWLLPGPFGVSQSLLSKRGKNCCIHPRMTVLAALVTSLCSVFLDLLL